MLSNSNIIASRKIIDLDNPNEKTELKGIVEEIVYRNTDTGYGVLEIDSNGIAVTAVGDLAFVNIGEEISASGCYTNHPTYGIQFRCDLVERILPTTSAAILKYLSNGAYICHEIPWTTLLQARRIHT